MFVFPELYSTGYVLDDLARLATPGEDAPRGPVAEFCSARRVWGVAGSVPVSVAGGIVNRIHVHDASGRLVHTADKVHLFRQMGEHRVFVPGRPSGVFDTPWMKAGAMICYDLRFPELVRGMSLSGAGIVFVPAEWPAVRTDLFRCLLRARAAENQIFAAGCNIGGSHLGTAFGGGGGVASPDGSLLPWTDVSPGVRDFDIDPQEAARVRHDVDCLADLRPEVYR